jgi:sugar O-acyltransferase (sialic acid O-acetyltransferase NeuD family)
VRRLVILGASGHGKVVGDAALLSGWDSIIFYDDRWPQLKTVGPWEVRGATIEITRSAADCDGVVVAIGDNRTRLARLKEIRTTMPMITVVHPAATVSPFAEIGPGCVIFAGAVVNAFAVIGAGCIINTSATVDHDCILADGVHLSPGSHLGGAVHVGEASWIGIGVAVRHGISIGANVTVGAGAAVVNDIANNLTAVGVPARPITRNPNYDSA